MLKLNRETETITGIFGEEFNYSPKLLVKINEIVRKNNGKLFTDDHQDEDEKLFLILGGLAMAFIQDKSSQKVALIISTLLKLVLKDDFDNTKISEIIWYLNENFTSKELLPLGSAVTDLVSDLLTNK